MVKDSESKPDRVAGHGSRFLPSAALHVFEHIENALYAAVAVVLVVVASVLLYRTVTDAFTSDRPFGEAITAAINGVLFVVIVLEIYRTVVAHLEGGGFQLRPFLVIGIISAVRHILLIGTQSLSGDTAKAFYRAQIELGVNAAVALGLVVALVLLHRSPDLTDDTSND